jgi:hypothetical protein
MGTTSNDTPFTPASPIPLTIGDIKIGEKCLYNGAIFTVFSVNGETEVVQLIGPGDNELSHLASIADFQRGADGILVKVVKEGPPKAVRVECPGLAPNWPGRPEASEGEAAPDTEPSGGSSTHNG